MLFVKQVLWFLQNLLLLHMQMISTYFYGLAICIEGDRITGIGIEQASYGHIQRMRLEGLIGSDSDQEDEALIDGEEDGQASS